MDNEDTPDVIPTVIPTRLPPEDSGIRVFNRKITDNEVELYKLLQTNFENARNELQEFMDLMRFKALKDKFEPEVK